jgi:hypothetical protein
MRELGPIIPRELFFCTLICTTEGRTNSATALYADDNARAAFCSSRVTFGAAGMGRRTPDELSNAAEETIRAAQATGLRFIST